MHYDKKHNIGEYTFLSGETNKGYYKLNKRHGESVTHKPDRKPSQCKYSNFGQKVIEY